MAVVNLIETKQSYTTTYGSAISFIDNTNECYRFSTDIERIDKMIEWLFENTDERFVLLGTDKIYFESEVDAMAFKLQWL